MKVRCEGDRYGWAYIEVQTIVQNWPNTQIPKMHLFHIPQCSIQNRNVHISVLVEHHGVWNRCIMGLWNWSIRHNTDSCTCTKLWAEVNNSFKFPKWAADLMWLTTHWGRDKMADIFQMIFLNAFSWMKTIDIKLKFYSQVSNKQYSSIGSDNGLAPTRRQAIIWTNDD